MTVEQKLFRPFRHLPVGETRKAKKPTLERRKIIADLEKKSWRNHTDLPYSIAREEQVSAGAFTRRVPEVMKRILKKEGEEFEKKNLRYVGVTRFISPLLQKLIWDMTVREWKKEKKKKSRKRKSRTQFA